MLLSDRWFRENRNHPSVALARRLRLQLPLTYQVLAETSAFPHYRRKCLSGGKTMRFSRPIIIGGLLALATSLASAQAQYPTKQITVIVPFAAGGPTDVVTRLVAEHMSRTLGQQLVIENIGGAGGTLGMTRAAQAEPD